MNYGIVFDHQETISSLSIDYTHVMSYDRQWYVWMTLYNVVHVAVNITRCECALGDL